MPERYIYTEGDPVTPGEPATPTNVTQETEAGTWHPISRNLSAAKVAELGDKAYDYMSTPPASKPATPGPASKPATTPTSQPASASAPITPGTPPPSAPVNSSTPASTPANSQPATQIAPGNEPVFSHPADSLANEDPADPDLAEVITASSPSAWSEPTDVQTNHTATFGDPLSRTARPTKRQPKSTPTGLLIGLSLVIVLAIGALVLPAFMIPSDVTVAGVALSSQAEADAKLSNVEQAIQGLSFTLTRVEADPVTLEASELGLTINHTQTLDPISTWAGRARIWVNRLMGAKELPLYISISNITKVADAAEAVSIDPVEPSIKITPEGPNVTPGKDGNVVSADAVSKAITDTITRLADEQSFPTTPVPVEVEATITNPVIGEVDIKKATDRINALLGKSLVLTSPDPETLKAVITTPPKAPTPNPAVTPTPASPATTPTVKPDAAKPEAKPSNKPEAKPEPAKPSAKPTQPAKPKPTQPAKPKPTQPPAQEGNGIDVATPVEDGKAANSQGDNAAHTRAINTILGAAKPAPTPSLDAFAGAFGNKVEQAKQGSKPDTAKPKPAKPAKPAAKPKPKPAKPKPAPVAKPPAVLQGPDGKGVSVQAKAPDYKLTRADIASFLYAEMFPDKAEGGRVHIVSRDDHLTPELQKYFASTAIPGEIKAHIEGVNEPLPKRSPFAKELHDVSLVKGTPVIDSITGSFVPDIKGTLQDAIASMEAGKTSLPVQGAKEAPASLEALGIKEPISTYTTYFVKGQTRSKNIQRIADMVDGYIIPPGQSFEVNHYIGKRTIAKGFYPGGALESGRSVTVIGGGISQFATTIFNAGYFAGLDIPKYKAHSQWFSRYPAGREATINYPTINLEFVNNTPYGILIDTSHTDSSVTVTMWSTKYWTVEATQGRCPCVPHGTFSTTWERKRTSPDGKSDVWKTLTKYVAPPPKLPNADEGH